MDQLPAVARLFREARKSDRARIAGALHDDVGPLLTGVAVELELLRLEAAARGDSTVPEQVKSIAASLERAFDRVRALSYEFHPDPVAKFGFYGALDRLAPCFQRRYPGRLRWRLDRSALPAPSLAGPLYEILECTLDNVLEALYSSEVRVSTTRTGGELTLTVSVPDGALQQFTEVVGRVLPLAAASGVQYELSTAGTRPNKVRYRA